MKGLAKRLVTGIGSIVLIGAMALPAAATDGYFQYGYGARQKGMGGAGVADSRDATAAALNPAGLVHVGDEATMSFTLFHPLRDVKGTPNSPFPGFTPTGETESDWNYFAIPNMAVNWHLDNNPFADAIALTVYGNGGMNTHYPAVARPDGACGPGTGVYCAGAAGVNLDQAFISLAIAKQFGNVSVGVAPIIATQAFSLRGVGAFAGISSDPTALTNNGPERVWGYGIRGGIELQASEALRFGLAGNSRIYMQEFDKYRGMFAEQGDFDIPASVQLGFAYDIMPNLTFAFDFKRIFYSQIASVANPSTNAQLCPATGGPGAPGAIGCLGSDSGAGFGWDDINVFKFGAEYRPSEDLSLRLGYSYNENPIQSRDVMLNILAPGVVQHHFTAGAEIRIDQDWDLELAAAYVPESRVRGFELAGFGNPTHEVDIGMSQFELTAGFTYRFGEPPMMPLK